MFDYSQITDLPESDPRHPIHHQDWDCSLDGPPPWWDIEFDPEKMAFVVRGKIVCTERRVLGVVTEPSDAAAD